jgi:hypothetical protein
MSKSTPVAPIKRKRRWSVIVSGVDGNHFLTAPTRKEAFSIAKSLSQTSRSVRVVDLQTGDRVLGKIRFDKRRIAA